MPARIYVANTTFWINLDGVDQLVKKRAEFPEGHPMLRNRAHLFDLKDTPAAKPVTITKPAPADGPEVTPAPKRRGRPPKNPR